MQEGFEVYDASGRLINSSTARFPKMIGEFDILGTEGQMTISIPTGSSPVFFAKKLDTKKDMPYVTMTPTKISWIYRKYGGGFLDNNYRASAHIIWGYY